MSLDDSKGMRDMITDLMTQIMHIAHVIWPFAVMAAALILVAWFLLLWFGIHDLYQSVRRQRLKEFYGVARHMAYKKRGY